MSVLRKAANTIATEIYRNIRAYVDQFAITLCPDDPDSILTVEEIIPFSTCLCAVESLV